MRRRAACEGIKRPPAGNARQLTEASLHGLTLELTPGLRCVKSTRQCAWSNKTLRPVEQAWTSWEEHRCADATSDTAGPRIRQLARLVCPPPPWLDGKAKETSYRQCARCLGILLPRVASREEPLGIYVFMVAMIMHVTHRREGGVSTSAQGTELSRLVMPSDSSVVGRSHIQPRGSCVWR